MSKEIKEKQQYINTIKFIVKRNTDKTYNIQAVAKMLGLPSDLGYTEECRLIVSYLRDKSTDNQIIRELLDVVGDVENICDVLVNTLYELFRPKILPNKAPIRISEKIYRSLIDKKKAESITDEENETLAEALNCKYCYCVKRIYLENKFKKFINDKEPLYNPYAVCINSIYKRRGFATPKKVSNSCRDKYDWYSKN